MNYIRILLLSNFLGAISAMAGVYVNGVELKGPSTTEIVSAGGLLQNGTVPMSGTLDMGNNSITNVSTNSLSFADGTKVSVLSNGVLGVSMGGTNSPKTVVDSGNIATYAPTPPTYYADGPTLLKSGTTFSVQPWITDNLIALRYETWNHWASQTMGLLDGPGYWFSDTNGIRLDLTWNFVFNGGYKNPASGVSGGLPTPTYQFKMNDNAADGVVVETQKGSNGTAQANTSTITTNGKINTAITFNGSSDYVTTPVNLDGATSVTICAWIQSANPSGIYTITAGDGGSRLYLYNSRIWFAVNGGYEDTHGTNTVGDGLWHHIAVSWNGGERAKVYTDGAYDDGCASEGSIQTALASGGPEHIGTRGDGYLYIGNLDDFRVYDTALSASDISAIYAAASESDYVGGGTTNTSDGVLCLTNSLLSFVPGYSMASALINKGTNTLVSSNLLLAVSRDGGTTWGEGIVALADSWDTSNSLATASITLTNQPTGSNVLFKLSITNSPPLVTVKGMAAPCGQ